MPIWIGDGNKARKVIAPYVGVSNKARRVLKGYIGVDNKARLIYTYLDDINYVEVEFYNLQYYTNFSTYGGRVLATGKAACANYGSSITLSESSNIVTAQIYAKGGTTNYGTSSNDRSYGGLYTHYRFNLVLKDGYKLSLAYPKTNDERTITVGASISNINYQSGSWYPFVWLLGDTDVFYDTVSNQSKTVTLLSGNSGGANAFTYYSNGHLQYTFSFNSPKIGNTTYPLKLKDSIAA